MAWWVFACKGFHLKSTTGFLVSLLGFKCIPLTAWDSCPLYPTDAQCLPQQVIWTSQSIPLSCISLLVAQRLQMHSWINRHILEWTIEKNCEQRQTVDDVLEEMLDMLTSVTNFTQKSRFLVLLPLALSSYATMLLLSQICECICMYNIFSESVMFAFENADDRLLKADSGKLQGSMDHLKNIVGIFGAHFPLSFCQVLQD